MQIAKLASGFGLVSMCLACAWFMSGGAVVSAEAAKSAAKAGTAEITREWTQWGGTPDKNNVPVGHNIPHEWEIGDFDYKTGEWDPSGAKNIKWVARLGSQTYGNAVVADGRVLIGTNNSGAYLSRYPSEVDLGVLLCFDAKDGKFLWQHSSEKLATGRVHDWPMQGICSAPLVEGKRLWFVTSRGEVRCLDMEGFHDNDENDGPYKEEDVVTRDEADVIWVVDMMGKLGVSQHNMASCSVTAAGDLLFVNTSNGIDEEHKYLPAPEAASFICLDKNTGEILWTDSSPGINVLHGQWSSPAYAVIDDVPQVIFGAGDGWVYSFDAHGEENPDGPYPRKAKLLWKFDANPKESFYTVSGKATRNHIIGTPVVYNNLVYVAVGEDPEHGEGAGHLWCIDPTKRGDVSTELAFNSADPDNPIAHKRLQAVVEEEGDFARANPKSAAVWHYSEVDRNDDGEIDFEETMHRTCGTVAIKDDILYIADFSGLFHCLDAKTGKPHWVYDMLAACWASPMIVDGKVYVGDEDGDISSFRHSSNPEEAMKDEDGELRPHYGEINMLNSVYTTPVVADNVLYISNRTHLFAIEQEKE